ncbi:MAG: chorismate synthase [Defluviitaleaceae bacterium]|nr:chorismate synthase [Defluviitaleaceae bacterium]
MGNSFGRVFVVTTFGESHGAFIGAVVDGCPAGLVLSPDDFLEDMARRRPGFDELSSKRREADAVQIISGVFEGLTLGTPIALLINNTDQRPEDYEELKDIHRPGHGDFTYTAKYGWRDHRGGGRASGRETAARVAAGVVAKKILAQMGIKISAKVAEIGGLPPDGAGELLREIMATGDSIGSNIICSIKGLKPGVGQPVFNKLEADLAKAVMSIGGARAVEFGMGCEAGKMRGSQHNLVDKGILAGISDGNDINFKVTFKPPPSVSIKGRHDPVIAPRAAVVVEGMAAIVLVDHIFRGLSSRLPLQS